MNNIEFIRINKIFISIIIISNYTNAQEWETPIIKGYGEVKYFDQAASQLNKQLEYKLIFDIKGNQVKNGVNKGLWTIARTLNLFELSGIPSKKIEIVASIHGEATFITLNSNAYQDKFGRDNPNSNIIQQLNDSGVKLYVCSQATSSRNINNGDLNINVIPALSGIAVLSNHLLRGFILMPNY